jgi:hypothetical protein
MNFANAFDAAFRATTTGYSQNEIPLFRALRSSILSLSNNFQVEVYHGNSHQVRFSGNGSEARYAARCELSDLAILVYSPLAKSIRLTYLQAKSERVRFSSVCGHQFYANLEQWFLLSQRPHISGIGKFSPPLDLLSGAILPSVGTFAFFYKDSLGHFQVYFATADYLAPTKKYPSQYGKVIAIGPCHFRIIAGHDECAAACGNIAFARALYSMQIGTPIMPTSTNNNLTTRNWLASNLDSLVTGATDSSNELVRGVIELLEPTVVENDGGGFGAKYLMIIKSESDT